MNKVRVYVFTLAALLLLTGAASANNEVSVKGDKSKEYGKAGIFQELNLTEQQQKRLGDNRAVQRQEVEKIRLVLREKMEKLQQALRNPSATRVSVEPIVNEIKSLQAKMTDLKVNGIFSVREILTPEQFAKFQEMMDKNKKERKDNFRMWKDKANCSGHSGKKPVSNK
jgi:Spy/CpxP family protein refolding chaperone